MTDHRHGHETLNDKRKAKETKKIYQRMSEFLEPGFLELVPSSPPPLAPDPLPLPPVTLEKRDPSLLPAPTFFGIVFPVSADA